MLGSACRQMGARTLCNVLVANGLRLILVLQWELVEAEAEGGGHG